MIAVDTNVLLRRILNDDDEQSEKAKKLFDGARPVLITDVVLVETVWTLSGKRYRATKEHIRAVVMSLLEEPNTVFEDKQALWSALNDFIGAKPVKTASGTKAADLADALIVNKAKTVCRDRCLSYDGTFTFDRAALQISGTNAP
jgi:predicted nucleic-acid-binding protein